MSKKHIVCQGLPCPQPVLKCKEVIESDHPEEITVTVDNEAAKDNVSRFMKTQGYTASTEPYGEDYLVKGVRSEDCPACETMDDAQLEAAAKHKILVFLPTDIMGGGDDVLGEKLMYNFLLTLKELGSDLWRIVMVNGGVKLSTEDSSCIGILQDLENKGVSILVCGTCLEHFELMDQRAVGQVTNMLDIVTSFQLAEKTIRI
ncbi:MAG: sulfurtransferase-like selenium metabolism protein YedF [Desulfovibrio sp.]|nr:sulfurtransferase-like selenium metabolism protein YedF [Desulfovibrio sp.]|tara:strand:- start:1651 stop:2259 length:609 start_codon:yes stop_codon:yes gene_type:complete